MVNNITNNNGQQYHQPQWSTISPTTMVNNITNHNGQQYHQQQWSTISPTTKTRLTHGVRYVHKQKTLSNVDWNGDPLLNL